LRSREVDRTPAVTQDDDAGVEHAPRSIARYDAATTTRDMRFSLGPARPRWHVPPMVRMLAVVALVSACKSDAAEREQRHDQWKREVARDQRARVTLDAPGAEPRRLLGPAMKPGDQLAADFELTSDIEIWRDSDVNRFRRHDVVHARTDLVAHTV